jgi:hypothetical protein
VLIAFCYYLTAYMISLESDAPLCYPIHVNLAPCNKVPVSILLVIFMNKQHMCVCQGWPEICVCRGHANNLAPFKLIFFELFQPMTGLVKFLRAHASIVDNFHRNSFVCV